VAAILSRSPIIKSFRIKELFDGHWHAAQSIAGQTGTATLLQSPRRDGA
jgi:hypothetical protein